MVLLNVLKEQGLGKLNIAVPNPAYAQVMSAATEHVLMNSFAGTDC